MGGIIGIKNHRNAAAFAQIGLFSLQHRGQESCGIASYDTKNRLFTLHRGSGLVMSAFSAEILATLKGDSAIGHVRHPTSGVKSGIYDAQPFTFNTSLGEIAIALSGNIINTKSILAQMRKKGAILQHSSETEFIIHLIAHENKPLEAALKKTLPQIEGGFAAVMISGGKLIAFRDPHGIRPLVLGKIEGAYIVASETSAMEALGGEYIRDIKPAEVIIVENGKIKSFFYTKAGKLQNCIFEQIYMSRPDSVIRAQSVADSRMEMGRRLAGQMQNIKADFVMPVPDSGVFAAMGFAQKANLPFEMGLIRNHYMGRALIKNAQTVRETSVKLKLLPINDIIEDKKIILIDDSIVRGTTSKKIIKLLRANGAKKVHFACTCPPIISPCFYGINMHTKQELIAANYAREQIRKEIGANSVTFLTVKNAREACGGKTGAQGFCFSCLSGKYIYKISKETRQGK
ncbi:MAG: amidophosphoribosyltransferase [Elusimicrobiota bacterium]|jgi:amidophosphoribosyltransferase|nr:amidophosphoribosyltransferase [Elusimicrobiota bacterium]